VRGRCEQRTSSEVRSAGSIESGSSRRRVPARTTVLLLAFLIAAGARLPEPNAQPGASPQSEAGFQQCEPISGPQWVFPPDSFSHSDLYGASITSDLYESFVVNFGCSQAAAYIRQIISQTLPITTPGTPNKLLVGPGFSCIAYPDANGKAYAGSCISGSAKFDWNYNVMWHGVPSSSSGEGGIGVEPMATIEYTTTLRPLGGGRYELVVQNSSAIGAIDSFTWSAPPGLTITAVTSSNGAKCSLQGGSISCRGALRPPQCLCTGSGGAVEIDFTATGGASTEADGHTVIHGFGWSYLRIEQMTPVPYLIPDAPQTPTKKSV